MTDSTRLTFKTLQTGCDWPTLLDWWLEAEKIDIALCTSCYLGLKQVTPDRHFCEIF